MQEVKVQEDAVTAVLRLVAEGFRPFVVGDPAAPDCLVYVRAAAGLRDMVKVHGPEAAEAVRMVGTGMTRRAEGVTADVVDAVLGWSNAV